MTRHVLVTGAAGGLGRALVEQGLAGGAVVYACPRVATPELESTDRLQVLPLDVTDSTQIDEVAAEIGRRTDRLDLLFNNAGQHAHSPRLAPPERCFELGRIAREPMLEMFAVNALAPLLLTQALAPLLRRGQGRVVNLSSRRGSLLENPQGGNYAYRSTKAALNMITRALGADLLPEVIAVAVHPGVVATRMGAGEPEHTAAEAAARLYALAERLVPAQAGRFLRLDGSEHPF